MFPWFVSVRSHTQNGLQSICGGSVIAPDWVLTAAHCTHGYVSYTLGFGSNDINMPLMSMSANEVIQHSKYNSDNLNYDISVIRLPQMLEFSSRIQAVRLPTMAQTLSGEFHTHMARVCGYGRTSDGECNDIYLYICLLVNRILFKIIYLYFNCNCKDRLKLCIFTLKCDHVILENLIYPELLLHFEFYVETKSN